jgi:hypothetical protein
MGARVFKGRGGSDGREEAGAIVSPGLRRKFDTTYFEECAIA